MPRVSAAPPLGLRWQTELDDAVIALAWDASGSRLAAASVAGPVTVFDPESGQSVHRLPGHRFGATAISWDSTAQLLASGGQDGCVRVWDARSGELIRQHDCGPVWVETVAWARTRPWLAASAGRTLRVWDDAGGLLRQEDGHSSTISDIAWHPRLPELAVAAYGGVTIWNLDRGDSRRFEWQGSSLALAWSPDARYLATGDQDATVHFWVVRSGEDLQMSGYEAKVRELDWDWSGRFLATGGSSVIVLWDCSGRGPAGTTPRMLSGHDDLVSALAWQPQGPRLASGGLDGAILLWQPIRGRKPVGRVQWNAGVTRLAWRPDGSALAAGGEAGTVAVMGVAQ